MNLIKKSILVLRNIGPSGFAKIAIEFLLSRILLKIDEKRAKKNIQEIIKQIKNFNSNNHNNPEEVFDFAWNFYSGLIRPTQTKEEFVELLKIFQKLNPNYILEIGTAKGGTLFCFCRLARPEATIISIDLPEGPFGGGYPEWKIPIYQAFAKENQGLYLIREDSHKKETFQKVKEILNDKRLDFLFIDGDHSYEGIKKDFEMYSPLVKRRSIIVFHDIIPCLPQTGCDVHKFWEEIKRQYQYIELIKDKNQKWAGIGVICIK